MALLLGGCELGASEGKDSSIAGDDSGGLDSGVNPWGTASLRWALEGADEVTVTDPDGAEGPAFFTESGGLQQGIATISHGLGGDFVDISFLSVDPGISTGALCLDFEHKAQSTGGCDWVSLGSGTITLSDGEVFSAIDWSTESGQAALSKVESTGDGSGWISFDFEFVLTKGEQRGVLSGSVTDAWMRP